jgi:hypothetical protein
VNESYCVIVSSCDAYADCWAPFFTLFARYWRPYSHVVYLNTETRAFRYPGLEIRCPRVGRNRRRELPWSERLLRVLDDVPFDVVLYLQEDYFLYDLVDVPLINDWAERMVRDGISHISLERSNLVSGGEASPVPFLSYLGQKADYRINAQAGLWQVQALKDYLRSHESVWEFEWYGTKRAARKRDVFCYLDDEYERSHGKGVIPYNGGIVQGRWARKMVVALFEQNGIEVDYTVRGFHDTEPPVYSHGSLPRRAWRRLRSAW